MFILSLFKRLLQNDDNELYELKCIPYAFPPSNINIQIKKTRKGYYYWRLITLDGKVLATSRSWPELGDCLKSASAVSHMYIGEIISSY